MKASKHIIVIFLNASSSVRVCVNKSRWVVGWLGGWMVGWLVGWLGGWMVVVWYLHRITFYLHIFYSKTYNKSYILI